MPPKRLAALLSLNATEEEDKENMLVDEMVERPKRAPRLFGFPSSKEPANEPLIEAKVVCETGGRRSMQLSPPVRLTKSEARRPGYGRGPGLPREEKEPRERATRRFSSMFDRTLADSDDEISLTREEKGKFQQGSRDDIATIIIRLFHVRNPRHGSKPRRNPSFKHQRHDSNHRQANHDKKQSNVKITVNFKTLWKHKQDLQATHNTIKTASAFLSTPAELGKSPTSKHHRPSSVCDSKFSSISSALSFTSLPHEAVAITAEQKSILLHLIRKVNRSLQHQKRITTTFSINLAHLLVQKEMILDKNKKLTRESRNMLKKIMVCLRGLVGRTFLKKAVFMERSLQLSNEMAAMLATPSPDLPAAEIGGLDAHRSGAGLDRDDWPLTSNMSLSLTTAELYDAAATLAPREHGLDVPNFLHSLRTLREDLDTQTQLDQALRAGIVGPCEDVRFPETLADRVAMKRFIAFMDGCLALLERRYREQGKVVEVLEALGRVLRDGCP